MPELNHQTTLHVPSLSVMPREGWTVFVDGEAPNWISTDERGAWLLQRLAESPVSFSRLVSRYESHFNMENGKAWVHVHAFVAEAVRHGIVGLAPFGRPPYHGRAGHLMLSRLRESWLHPNNSCNLSCHHCLVSSSPRGEEGLPTAAWTGLIDQVAGLGVDRFYLTGGEPFVRRDLPELIHRITEHHEIELDQLHQPFGRGRVGGAGDPVALAREEFLQQLANAVVVAWQRTPIAFQPSQAI